MTEKCSSRESCANSAESLHGGDEGSMKICTRSKMVVEGVVRVGFVQISKLAFLSALGTSAAGSRNEGQEGIRCSMSVTKMIDKIRNESNLTVPQKPSE
jgi:hypothetical protein